jgi:hypothetical protein
VLFGLVFFAAPIWAQFEPTGSHVILYFPHFADGGSAAQRWQTTFLLYNTNTRLAADIQLSLYADDGKPLSLNFGSGSKAVHELRIPPRGVAELRSTMASTSIVSGSAVMIASTPVQGTLLFRAIEQGVHKVELSAAATPPTHVYKSLATSDLGVALMNPYSATAVSVIVGAVDATGNDVGWAKLTLPPQGHKSFNLQSVIPKLGGSFFGTVEIAVEEPGMNVVAWTLNAREGLLSTLPSGVRSWPVASWDLTWLSFSKVLTAAQTWLSPGLDLTTPPIRLNISQSPQINAFASGGTIIQVNLALAELLSESPSELGFVLAHEMAHIIQQRTGKWFFVPGNVELDADRMGVLISLLAGFDPYAGAGALSKIAMVSNQADLVSQVFLAELFDIHKSINTRIASMYDSIKVMCASSADVAKFCEDYRKQIHPNFPTDIPLSLPIRPGEPAAR